MLIFGGDNNGKLPGGCRGLETVVSATEVAFNSSNDHSVEGRYPILLAEGNCQQRDPDQPSPN